MIIILVETWLCGSILNSELGLKNFNIYRCDRSKETSAFQRGGGVLVAVHESLSNRPMRLTVTCIEQVFVEVRCGF